MAAADRGHTDIVRSLLDAGADLNLQDIVNGAMQSVGWIICQCAPHT